MPDLQALLDQIDRLDKSAKAGPWEVWPQMDDNGATYPECIAGPENDLYGARGWDNKHYIQEVPELTMEDAEFIALARTALPQLAKALQAVIADCDETIEDADNYGMADMHLAGQGAKARAIRNIITKTLGADDE